ncbi:hypothetical protein N878_00395 [Pseudomonas sp. EGD-AK9]|nr:hypothetical protein N878_00395 [Pseudomonas sp. EGD-AK9]
MRQNFAWRVHSTGEMIFWDLSCLEGDVELPYALHLGQDKLAKILISHLEALPNVEVRYSSPVVECSVSPQSVQVVLGAQSAGEVVEGEWLIGADGANSFVRREVMKQNFFGITWPQRYVATNTKFDFDSLGFGKTTMQVDDVYGSVICNIDSDSLWRVTFMEDPNLPVDGIRGRIDQMFKGLLPTDDPYEVVAFSPYRMHQRVADTMRRGRVILIGDAAHVTNPTGGLGLTGGMFDAFALTSALNQVIHDGRSEDILDVFEADRRRKFIELVSPRASDNLRNLYHQKPGEAKDDWVKNTRDISKDIDRMREALRFPEVMETLI